MEDMEKDACSEEPKEKPTPTTIEEKMAEAKQRLYDKRTRLEKSLTDLEEIISLIEN